MKTLPDSYCKVCLMQLQDTHGNQRFFLSFVESPPHKCRKYARVHCADTATEELFIVCTYGMYCLFKFSIIRAVDLRSVCITVTNQELLNCESVASICFSGIQENASSVVNRLYCTGRLSDSLWINQFVVS